jgi:hypothetical protein
MTSTTWRTCRRTAPVAALVSAVLASAVLAAPLFLPLAAREAAPRASPAKPATPPHWLLAFDGCSTNEVAHDPRLGRLITRQIPAAMATTLRAALGGPPDPLQVTDGRTVAMSACQPHACGTKGFLWLDLAAGTALGAIYHAPTLRLASRALAPDTLPAAARTALLGWLDDLDATPRTVRFTNARGTVTRPATAPFTPTGRYRPPPGGPSFDCIGATSPVARTTSARGDRPRRCAAVTLPARRARSWWRSTTPGAAGSTRAAAAPPIARPVCARSSAASTRRSAIGSHARRSGRRNATGRHAPLFPMATAYKFGHTCLPHVHCRSGPDPHFPSFRHRRSGTDRQPSLVSSRCPACG